MFQAVSGTRMDRWTFKKDMTYIMRIIYKSNAISKM